MRPRVSGVSFNSTVWRIRRKPMLRTTSPWLLLKPIGLFTSVTLTVPLPFVSVRWFAIVVQSISLVILAFGHRVIHDQITKFPNDQIHPDLSSLPGELVDFLAAHPRDEHRVLQRIEPGNRRPHDVVRIGRSERFRQDVRNAR